MDAAWRSTPSHIEDLTHLRDKDGHLWCYSAVDDRWRRRERDSKASFVDLASARTWAQLWREFGPLSPIEEVKN